MVTPVDVAANVVLADAGVTATRPNDVRYQSMALSDGGLDALAAAFETLCGGATEEHPFVASVARLRERVGREGWRWFGDNDDAMAAMLVASFDHLRHCWGGHPDLVRLAASLSVSGRYLRTLAAFAAGTLMFEGNRIGFQLQAPAQELSLRVAMGDEPLAFMLSAPDALQWPARDRRSPQVLERTVIDALASARGQVNRARPGMVVLLSSILQPDFDQMLIDAIHAAYRAAGRRHGGVAAVVVLGPKVFPVQQMDEVGFAYALYPIVNPHFAGENPIRLR